MADVGGHESDGDQCGSGAPRGRPPHRGAARCEDSVMSPALASFHHGRREVLAALADLLIPSADGMPSASEAGTAGRWLDEVLQLRPDFGPPLAAVLDRPLRAAPAAALTTPRTDHPARLRRLAA